jgi:acyl transferase domain-containing protein
VAIYVKSLRRANRDGNPIRSVIVGSAANSDGRTIPASMPSATAQAAMIRRAYAVAGLQDVGKTGLFECHATGTVTGDPIECDAIASVFGDVGVYVGTVKPNMGHSEAASGLTAVLKATLALEQRVRTLRRPMRGALPVLTHQDDPTEHKIRSAQPTHPF